MVRTGVRGFRIGSGRSSAKKVGGASVSVSLTPKKSGGSSSIRLPPIPYQETPSWQKPITNFFTKSNSPKKGDNSSDNENYDSHKETTEKESESQVTKKVRLEDESEEINEIEVTTEIEIVEESESNSA